MEKIRVEDSSSPHFILKIKLLYFFEVTHEMIRGKNQITEATASKVKGRGMNTENEV